MGAAMTGLRPIAEIMFSDFFAVCWDIVANEIAKSRYMTNGQVSFPLVIKSGNGGGLRFGAQHSQAVENWAMAVPGLKVVAPSNPADVVGLMAAAVRDPDPVLFWLPVGTVTFLFTDIEDSTRLWEEAPTDMADALRVHDAIVRGTIERHGGYVFGIGGDGFCAAFSTAADAAAAAIESQEQLRDDRPSTSRFAWVCTPVRRSNATGTTSAAR